MMRYAGLILGLLLLALAAWLVLEAVSRMQVLP